MRAPARLSAEELAPCATPAEACAALAEALGGGARVALGELAGIVPEPWPEERVAIARARPERAREFALGRALARRLLVELDLPPAAIPAGADRAPLWPAGVVGSLAHSRAWCAVALARADARGAPAALGIDVDDAEPLEEALQELVCTPRELAGLPASERGLRARAAFCAKEAAYKALGPRRADVRGFHDLVAELDGGALRVFLAAEPALTSRGRLVLVGGSFVAALARRS